MEVKEYALICLALSQKAFAMHVGCIKCNGFHHVYWLLSERSTRISGRSTLALVMLSLGFDTKKERETVAEAKAQTLKI